MGKFTVIQDTKEQKGWTFEENAYCEGMVRENLPTGDYTIKDFEKIFVIERKADTGEFARNITEGRFERELVRMEDFQLPFMVLEFTMNDILCFPHGSGIPKQVWPKLRITGRFMLKRLLDFETIYKTKIILAGRHGKDVAFSLFLRVLEWQRINQQ